MRITPINNQQKSTPNFKADINVTNELRTLLREQASIHSKEVVQEQFDKLKEELKNDNITLSLCSTKNHTNKYTLFYSMVVTAKEDKFANSVYLEYDSCTNALSKLLQGFRMAAANVKLSKLGMDNVISEILHSDKK